MKLIIGMFATAALAAGACDRNNSQRTTPAAAPQTSSLNTPAPINDPVYDPNRTGTSAGSGQPGMGSGYGEPGMGSGYQPGYPEPGTGSGSYPPGSGSGGSIPDATGIPGPIDETPAPTSPTPTPGQPGGTSTP